MDKLLVSVSEAATMLSISRSSCYEMIQKGIVPVVQMGSIKRVPVDGLVGMVNQLREARGESDKSIV